MAYTWTNGELITAEKLNDAAKMMVVNVTVDGTVRTLDKTWQEIHDTLEKNTLVLAKRPTEEGTTASVGYDIVFTAYIGNPLPGQEPYYGVLSVAFGVSGNNITNFVCAEPTSYPSYSVSDEGDLS